MKKLYFLLIVLLFSLTSVFATKKICMSPYNQELANLLSSGLGLTVNKAKTDYSIDYLSSTDKRLVELVLKDSDSEILLIPQLTQKDGFNIIKINYYYPEEGEFKTIYSYISKTETGIPVTSLLSLQEYLSDSRKGIVKLDNYKSGSLIVCDNKTVKTINDCLLLEEGKHTISITAYGYKKLTKSIEIKKGEEISLDVQMEEALYSNLTIKSDIPASVLKDSNILGNTPFTLESYSVPVVLRLKADGYADTIINITEQTNEFNAKLKPSWMENGEIYTKARDKFYMSFARSIIIFGAKVAFNAIENYKPQVAKAGKGISDVLLTLSITDLVYNLFNYCRYAEFISP